MNKNRTRHISKFLSFVLRHQPGMAGLSLDQEGWVEVEALLAGAKRAGIAITREELLRIVATSDKQRFALSENNRRIRANQGHSLPIDLGLEPSEPPAVLFHGTVDNAVLSILTMGIEKRSRQYVHLSPDVDTALKVGARHGRSVVLRVNASAMHAVGHRFYLSNNGVWLVDSVLPQFVSRQ